MERDAARQGGRPLTGLPALFRSTLRALLAPRRLLPILLVCVPLVVAQQRFSASGAAVWVAAVMCALFVAVGPFAWRALFPPGRGYALLLPRLLAYSLLGGLPALAGWVMPTVFDLGETFLTAGVNMLISATLFWVGGWGLARDVELEEGLRRERQRAEGLAREAEHAQLLALRAQLDPHFLFNTLNAIAEWCREDGRVAERAILKLSSMLRQVLDGVRQPSWPLARELALVRDLYDLHLVRDPQRFALRWEVAEPVPGLPVPPLLLLPLAENAVKHGPARGHRGELAVLLDTVQEQGRPLLRLRFRNPGPFSPGGGSGGGQGLTMVRQRLELAWPGRARLEIGTVDGGTEAVLLLPLDAVGPEKTT